MRNFFRIFLITLVLTSCASDEMPRYSILQGLRVLELVIDQPEIDFDGTTFTPNSVQVTPWISDLYGAGRALEKNVYWCLDPGIGLGARPTCTGNPTLTTILTADPVAPNATATGYQAPNYTGDIAPFTVNVAGLSASVQAALTASFATLNAAQLNNGVALLIFFELYPASDVSQKVTVLKRLVFSSAVKPTKNQNPTGLEIRSTGAEITSFPTTTTDLTAFYPAGQAESYTQINSDGSTTSETESLTTTWFFTGPADVECSKKKECSTDGVFTLFVTNPDELNTFNPPQVATPTTRGRVLVAVGKDNRGGAVVKRYCDGTCP